MDKYFENKCSFCGLKELVKIPEKKPELPEEWVHVTADVIGHIQNKQNQIINYLKSRE